MFNFVQPIEVIQQRGGKAFIDLLNKACVGNEKSEVERTLKSRIIWSSDLYYPKYALDVFTENALEFSHNKVMLDQINGKLITIDAIDSIHIGCGFSDSQITAAGNRNISQKGALPKTLTLKLESKNMLTTNIDITDHLINRQIEAVKYLNFLWIKLILYT